MGTRDSGSKVLELPGPQLGSAPLSPGGLVEAQRLLLAFLSRCLLKKPPPWLLPGVWRRGPRMRAFWEGTARNRLASAGFGLQERGQQREKGTCRGCVSQPRKGHPTATPCHPSNTRLQASATQATLCIGETSVGDT
jgi:hypothetical protein